MQGLCPHAQGRVWDVEVLREVLSEQVAFGPGLSQSLSRFGCKCFSKSLAQPVGRNPLGSKDPFT